LGVVIVIPPSLFLLFEVLRGSARNVKLRQGFLMIWHATLWCIWKARNSSIFANGSFIPKVIVDEIKIMRWKWCLTRMNLSPCLFYEWTWDPEIVYFVDFGAVLLFGCCYALVSAFFLVLASALAFDGMASCVL
ncbi:myb-like transcription factor, partial [Trifolium medium]|nr:myb-like transcription factor [Trifolium medium]